MRGSRDVTHYFRRMAIKLSIAGLVAPLIAVILAPAQIVSSANAAGVPSSASMTINSVSWNIIGLDSNRVTVGPNEFPVGAKVCNTSGATISPTMQWTWGAGDATALNIVGPSSYPETINAGTCAYAFWTVRVTRDAASYFKTRAYSISATIASPSAETVSTDPAVSLRVEKLVSQGRNTVQTVSISNPLININDTATVTMRGTTATAYEQLTAWPIFDLSVAHIVSMNMSFSANTSTLVSPVSQIYADGCNWDALNNVCLGSGKTGGNITTTIVIKKVAAGSFGMNAVIYDLSGGSFHYNSDYGINGVLTPGQVVSPPPVVNQAFSDSYFTSKNTSLSGNVGTNDVKTGTYYFETTSLPSHGSLGSSFNQSTGAFTYVPDLNFSGTDTFTYKLCSGAAPSTDCVNATVTIHVSTQAVDDIYQTPFQTVLSGNSVEENDYYGDFTLGTDITFETVSLPTHGSITSFNTANGFFSYTPNAGYSGPDSFTYNLCRVNCSTDTSRATVTINVGPNAVNDSYSTFSGINVSSNVNRNDIYPATKIFTLISAANANGTVNLNGASGDFIYTPNPGYVGVATFQYNVCDAFSQCSTATVTITVVPEPIYVAPPVDPIIIWPTPAPYYYPSLLSNIQLNAVAKYNGSEVPGTYNYQYPTGTKLNPGSYPMLVTFTPTDRTKYNPVSTSVIQVVLKPSPTITWPTPGPKLGPYTLDPTVLNAVCSVPGTLNYDPALGTVLQPGTYTLKVTCNPTDPNYGPITTTVTLVVVPAAKIDVPPQIIPGEVKTELPVPSEIEKLSPVIDILCDGLVGAILANGKIEYTPKPGFSGNTCVNVKVLISGVLQSVRVPVIVNPVAPDAYKTPVTFLKGLITWNASPNATGYRVEIRGKVICTTTALTCSAPQTVGPITPVKVTALGNDNTSTTVDATYKMNKVLAFKVYFDNAKYLLNKEAIAELNSVARVMKQEGFTNIEIDGHTDNSTYDNRTLSANRAKITAAYLQKLLPGLKITLVANSDSLPAATNSTVTGKAKNRRAEGVVF